MSDELDLVSLARLHAEGQPEDWPEGLDLQSKDWWVSQAKAARSRARDARAAWEAAARIDPSWAYFFNASLAAQRIPDQESAERLAFASLRAERNARTIAQMSNVLQARRKKEAALAFARAAVQQFPDVEDGHVELTFALGAMSRYDEAEEVARAAIRLDSNRVRMALAAALRWQAGQRASEGSPDRARAYLEEAQQAYTAAFNLLQVALVYESRLGDRAKAIELLEHAHRIAPDDRSVQSNLGRVLYRSGRHEDGLPLLRADFEANLTNHHAAHALANALAELIRTPEAEAVAIQHLEVSTYPVELLHHLGHQYQDVRRFEDAEAAWLASLEELPSFTKLHYDLARLYRWQERLTEAEATLAEGLEKKPDCVHCRIGRVELDEARDDLQAASTKVTALLESHPDNLYVELVASRVARKHGDVESARARAKKVLARRPADTDAMHALGLAQLEAGNVVASVPLLRQAVDHNPDLVPQRYADLARALDSVNPQRASEVRRDQAAFEQRLVDSGAQMKGFAAVHWTKTKRPATPPSAEPKGEPASESWSKRAAAAIESAEAWLARFSEDERMEIEALEDVDFDAVDRLVDDLYVCDPAHWNARGTSPVELDVDDVLAAQDATEALEAHLEQLRAALESPSQ